MKTRLSVLLFALFLSFSASGCVGMIYSDVTAPLSTDMNNTPIGEVQAQGSSHFVKEPVSSLNISAEWSSYAIGNAAEAEELGKLRYADVRVLSILQIPGFIGPIYQRKTVLVYGEKPAPK
jgi:hypothetical protein